MNPSTLASRLPTDDELNLLPSGMTMHFSCPTNVCGTVQERIDWIKRFVSQADKVAAKFRVTLWWPAALTREPQPPQPPGKWDLVNTADLWPDDEPASTQAAPANSTPETNTRQQGWGIEGLMVFNFHNDDLGAIPNRTGRIGMEVREALCKLAEGQGAELYFLEMRIPVQFWKAAFKIAANNLQTDDLVAPRKV